MNYYEKINEYLDAERGSISAETREAERNAIKLGVDFLTQKGLDAPNETFYAELKTELLNKYNYQDSTVNRKKLPPIKKFFAWTARIVKQVKSETTPNDSQTLITVSQAPVMPSSHNVRTHNGGTLDIKNKGGRPRKTDTETGEDYSKKVTVYLSPSLEADVRILAESQDTNINGYIRGLVIADRNAKREKIQALHGVKDAYEKSRAAYLEALRNI